MKLTLPEAAALLGAGHDRVHDWIEDDDLPAQKIRGEYRINRTDLLEWATEHDIGVAPRAFRGEHGMPSLAAALRSGGVHDGVTGKDLESVLRHIVKRLPLADDSDREVLLAILLARGARGLTLVGDGIAIPQVRTPIVLAPSIAVMALWFLTAQIDLQASDGKPVDTFFLLISPTVHVHLAMLAQLTFALKDAGFRDAVRRRASEDEVVRLASALEEEF